MLTLYDFNNNIYLTIVFNTYIWFIHEFMLHKHLDFRYTLN